MRKNNFLKLKFLLVLFGVTCFLGINICTSILATNFEETFLKANDCYNNKKYKEALELYKSIDCKGPVTIYNIGNCEFVLGKYVDALVFWNKAKKHASFALLDDINYNIDLARYKLGVTGAPGLQGASGQKFSAGQGTQGVLSWNKFTDIVNLFYLFNLQIIFLFFWFLFFIFYIFLKKLRLVFLTLNIFLIIFSGTCVFVKYNFENYPLAILKNASSVFYGPSEKYHKLTAIALAQKVEIREIDKNWCKIRYNGFTGWILSSNLAVI